MTRGEGTYTMDILAHSGLQHPHMLLTCQRLSLFDRLMQTELTELMALLQAQDPRAG